MTIKKYACTNLEINSELKPLSNLNIEFYDQDINTSVLHFTLKKCNTTINLDRKKIEPYIMLVAEDGSKVRDYLTLYDGQNGIVSYKIPKDFLKHIGRVVGQVYLYQNDNILVTRTFSFTIKESLVNSFDSETKLEYIKTFDDLETVIKNKVIAIDAEIANGADYVTGMENAAEKGQKDIQVVATKATADVNKAATDATEKITDTSNRAVANVEVKTKEVLDAINNNEVVKITDITSFQKYQITEDSGSSRSVIDYDLLNTDDIKNFNGYVASVKNTPQGVADRGHLERTYYSKSITITYTPFNENSIYSNVHDFSKKIWLGWEKIITASEIATTQKQKITTDSGAPLYDLNSTKDLFAEILKWGNGFFTFYLSAGATNNPTGTTSWLRGTVSTYGKNSNILAYDESGTMYVVVCANGVWGTWGKTQIYKTTEDNGSSITLNSYDLLNTTDVSNFDGYVTSAKNAPTTSNAGYVKRKYRSGYIEITFAPHSSKDVYRNSYNGNTAVSSWVGWEKLVTASELLAIQPITLWEGSANGVSSTVYSLSRAVNLNRKIRVTFDFVGGSGITATFDLKANRIASINNFNISDAAATEPALYEWQLDFTSLTGFAIKLDNLHNLVTGAGSMNRKAYTATKIEEVE